MSAALALLVAASAPGPSTLERAASAVVTKLEAARLEGPIAVHVEGATPALSRAFATVLCGRLVSAKVPCDVVEAASPADAAERARSQGRSTVVRLTVQASGTALVVQGDALETWKNVWAGDAPGRSERAASLGLSLEADAEVLAFAGPLTPPAPPPSVPLELVLSSFARLPTVPVALAAGDLDGDLRAEMAVLLGEDVVVYSAEGKVLARYDLASAPPAAAMLREPFGALAITGAPPRLVAWSGRRARAEVLAFNGTSLKPVASQDTITLDGLTARLEPGLNRFLPEVQQGGRTVRLPSGFQAASTRGGVTMLLWPDGTGTIARQWPPTGRFSDVGTGSALGDVDRDGVPEVLVSTARTVGDADEVRLVSLSVVEGLAANGQSIRSVPAPWQASLKGRVLVMCAADVDGTGADAFLFGTWLSDGTGELFIARRVKP
jgi:hypothetical protein